MSHKFGDVKAEATAIAAAILEEVANAPAAVIAGREDVIAAADELRVAADMLEEKALGVWPGRYEEVRVDGVGSYARGVKATKDEWDDRGTGLAVAKAALAKGMIHHPSDVVDILLGAAGVGYWRVGALTKLGLDATQYRTRLPGQPTIHKVQM